MADYTSPFTGAEIDAGVAGSSNFTLPTAIDILAFKAVANALNQGIYADNTDAAKMAVGISTGPVTAGTDVVLKTGGAITVTGAGWTDNLPVYASTGGALTQTKPTSGFVQEVGRASGADILIVNIQNIKIDGGNFT
jgi:hypothetical protein